MVRTWQSKGPYYSTKHMIEPWVGWSICTPDGVEGPFATLEEAEAARQSRIVAEREARPC